MGKYYYFPILQTRDAELKGLDRLDSEVKDCILPIFELTRSRRTKNNNEGDIWKRIDQIKDAVGVRPFALDVTQLPTLSNAQTAQLLSSNDNFSSWVNFIREVKGRGLNVIPTIHFDPDDLNSSKEEIVNLLKLSEFLLFRVDVRDSDVIDILKKLERVCDFSRLIVLLDAGFQSLEETPSGNFKTIYDEAINELNLSKKRPKAIICALSTFPAYVLGNGYGREDAHDKFLIGENITNKALGKEIFHGDYAAIHPNIQEGGGGWVPRIDFTNEDNFYYYRYRREEGGYVEAAKKIIASPHYCEIDNIRTWADEEIKLASRGIPNGRNPGHWIAVRVNLFVTKQFIRLRKSSGFSL